MTLARAAALAALITLLLFGYSTVGHYNDLSRLDERVAQRFANLDVVLQRRADLIPNLVSTVQGAAQFERETFVAVSEARSAAAAARQRMMSAPAATPDMTAAYLLSQQQLGTALQGVLGYVERYPELRATAAFLDLQTQLEGTENRIAHERRQYNAAVQAKNTAIRRFPAALYARLFGFASSPYFQADAGAANAPDVDFGR
jgi:LemA protein